MEPQSYRLMKLTMLDNTHVVMVLEERYYYPLLQALELVHILREIIWYCLVEPK